MYPYTIFLDKSTTPSSTGHMQYIFVHPEPRIRADLNYIFTELFYFPPSAQVNGTRPACMILVNEADNWS